MAAISITSLVARTPTISSDNLGPVLNLLSWIAMTIMILTVVTALLSKYVMSRRFGWDDLLITCGMAFAIGQSIAVSAAVHDGLGQPTKNLTSSQLVGFQKARYTSQLLYLISLIFAKISTLLFVLHLTPNKKHHAPILVGSAIVVVWGVVSMVTSAFQCALPQPWAIQSDHCYNQIAFWTVIGILDILTDAGIMAVPIVVVYDLAVPRSKKYVIMSAFGFRILPIVATICRIVYLIPAIRAVDYTKKAFGFQLATQLEVNLSVFAACVPHLRPFMKSLEADYYSGVIRDPTVVGSHNGTSGSYAMEKVGHGKGTRSDSRPGLKSASSNNRVTVQSTAKSRNRLDDTNSDHSTGSHAMIIKQTKEWTVSYDD